MKFGVDQQEIFQGYMPVILATTHYTTNHYLIPAINSETNKKIFVESGPLMVNTYEESNAKKCQKSAYNYCRDPKEWLNIPDGCNCINTTNFKLVIVHHGKTATDEKWQIFENGVKLAANDLKINDQITIIAAEREDSEEVLTNLNQTILGNNKPFGIIATAITQGIGDLFVTAKQQNITMLNVNTGLRYVNSSNRLMFIGQVCIHILCIFILILLRKQIQIFLILFGFSLFFCE